MSYTPNNAWDRSPQTGLSSNPGPFIAEVMKNDDPLYSGRLLVYIPDFGGDVTQESSWHLVRYMSPYYGIQPLSNRLAADPADPNTLQSYGMWMAPPDLGVKVLVMFVNGDRSRGIWMGCLPEIGSHGAIPGNDAGDFDIFTNQTTANSDIQSIPRPPHSTAPTFVSQGLAEDEKRGGAITTSSLRESPTNVFGFNTPGGHSFFMDDGDSSGNNKIYRMRTAAGNMIMLNDDSGFVYVINSKGNAWLELSPNGQVDVYGEGGINFATKGNIEMHANGNINLHAGQNLKAVAEQETKIQGTRETKVYGGKLYLQGSDGLDMFTCGQLKFTANRGLHFKSEGEFVLEGRVFKWNSGGAAEAEQVAPDEPGDITGYRSTVSRAPNREPWQGHDGNFEPTPVSPSSLTNANAASDSAFDPIRGTYDEAGLGLPSAVNAPGSSSITPAGFNPGGSVISAASDLANQAEFIRRSVEDAGLTFGDLTQRLQSVTPNFRQQVLEDLNLGQFNVVDVENTIRQVGTISSAINGIANIDDAFNQLRFTDIENAFSQIGNLQDIASQFNFSDVENILGSLDIDISSQINLGSFVGEIGNISQAFGQLNNLTNIASQLSFGDLSVGDIGNITNLASQLSFGNLSIENLLPSNNIIQNALSIRSNILNAESLIQDLAAPLTSISGLVENFDIGNLSGLISSIDSIDIRNIAGSFGDLTNVLGDVGDNFGNIVGNLPVNLPVGGLAGLVPPDIGNALGDAASALGNIAGADASSILPSAPGGSAPASAVGSDCTAPITRNGPTPAQQGAAAGGNSGGAYPGAPGNVVPPDELANDPEWQAELARLKTRFPELDEGDLYRIIQGESGFNSTIVNRDSGATGLFQFIPSTARGLGTSTAEIQRMTPAEQLRVYGNYLGQFNYGGGPLGIMQAAPGTYSNLIRDYGSWSRVPSNVEVYERGSAAWRQNPGWRGADGRITIGSINAYYGNQRS